MAKKKNKVKSAGHQKSTKRPAAESANPELPPTSALAPVLMKVCRLCEVKDGPFLNIFDLETTIAKKIDTLLPFSVLENDELPHKICFRCSAKVEELHDFVQKCIKTQESLHLQIGKKSNLLLKSKMRMVWEEKLTQSNISNDELCDAVIQKAMAGIKNLSPVLLKETVVKNKTTSVVEEVPTKKPKVEEEETCVRVTRNKSDVTSQPEAKEHVEPEPKTNQKELKKRKNTDKQETESRAVKETKSEPEKPFNIMDFVSIIKVNGVGVLFQCHKCNRNFLNKEIVMSHSCAKTGCAPIEIMPNLVPLQPPKNPMASIKFINSKPGTETAAVNNSVTEKPKPRIGPASKVKRVNDVPLVGMKVSPREPTPPPPPLVHSAATFPFNAAATTGTFPLSLPGLSSKHNFKLVPGPNNTFRLLEASDSAEAPPAPTATNRPGPKSRKAPVNSADGAPPRAGAAPYPVGLFHALGTSPVPPPPPAGAQPAPFTTPAMRKQSYSVVQTGDPSKLLISTKPQETNSKRRATSIALPVLNNAAFNFVNVDKARASHPLPVGSTIQESQISTSTQRQPPAAAQPPAPPQPYACSLCTETFTREKKLLVHIQNHYNKMDEETEGKVRGKRKTRKT